MTAKRPPQQAKEPSLRKRPTTRKLTLDMIFSKPGLAGVDISQVNWSPDGRWLTYNRGFEKKNQVIAYDPVTLQRHVAFDYAKILPKDSTQSRQWFWDGDGERLPWRMRQTNTLNLLTFGYDWVPRSQMLWVTASETGPYYLVDPFKGTVSPQLPIPQAAKDVDFSPDAALLTYVLDYNLYGLDVRTGQTIALTQGGTEAFSYGTPDIYGDFLDEGYWWSGDGSRVACLVSDESAVLPFPVQESTSFDGSSVTERFPLPGQTSPQMGLLVIGRMGSTLINPGPYADYYLARVNWLPDSRRLALQLMSRRQNHLVLLIVDSETGSYYPVLEEHDRHWINLSDDLTFFRDGTRFLWSTERQSQRHIHLYSIEGRHLAQLTSGDCAAIKLKGLDEKTGSVFYKTYPEPYLDGHVMKVTYADSASGVKVGPATKLTTEPGAHSVVLSPHFRFFADLHSTATTPPHLDLYTGSGEFRGTIEKNNARELAGRLAPVHFTPLIRAAKTGHSSDHFGLCGRILTPPGMRPGKKYPAIVYVYGGPSPMGIVRTVLNRWFYLPDLWLQYMAQQGFVVFSLDNRGSGEAPRGHDFETPIAGHFGKVELADQLEGVKYLKSLPYVDGTRLGILGGSFGGFMVLNAMLRAPDVFKAGVSFAPVTEWMGFDSIYSERYMDLPDNNREGYNGTRLPPLAPQLKAKLLLLHGTADMNVHLPHSFRMAEAFQESGIDFDFMLYPQQGHDLFFETGQVAQGLYQRIGQFFQTHLQGK